MNSKINNSKTAKEYKYNVNKIPIMPTLTKTRAMSHADTLAALNATAKKAATQTRLRRRKMIRRKKRRNRPKQHN
jgi:hypothetical protein